MSNRPATEDEVFLTTGKLVQNAVVCEQFMWMAFATITQLNHEVARAIFYTFDTFSGKKNLLKRVTNIKSDEEDRKLIMLITDAVEKANKQRTELAHAAFSFEGEGEQSTFKLYRPEWRNRYRHA